MTSSCLVDGAVYSVSVWPVVIPSSCYPAMYSNSSYSTLYDRCPPQHEPDSRQNMKSPAPIENGGKPFRSGLATERNRKAKMREFLAPSRGLPVNSEEECMVRARERERERAG